jgi:hypothetical protein
VRTLSTATTVIADRADGAGGAVAGGETDRATISADGTRVAFASNATNLGDGDADNKPDIHVRDLVAGTTVLASRADGDAGAKGDTASYVPVIARDGRSVAFRSSAKNLDTTIGVLPPGTPNQGYVRNLDAKTTRLFSRLGADGAVSDRAVGPISLSADGSVVAFELDRGATAPNLIPSAAPRTDTVVVRTLATGATRTLAAAATDPTDAQGSQGVESPSLSADGRCVAFTGRGRDIVPGVSPDFDQLYLRVLDGDCQTTVPVVPGPGPDPTPTPTPTPGKELTPIISLLTVTNKTFRVGTKATAKVAAVSRKKKRAPVGTTFRYTLNVQADTAITIQLKTKGRKVGSTCKAATKALRKRKSCTRFVKVMALARGAKPEGKAKVAFSGKVGKVKLKPGSYRALLVAVGTGPSKKRSRVRQVTFKVVR